MKYIALLLLTISLQAQDYVYGGFSVDPNQAIGIIDNPRTEVETLGFDWDLELGVRYHHFGVYAFYGAFQEINYQNYGAGADYFFNWFVFDTSIGFNHGVILRKDGNGNWGGVNASALRGQIIYWLGDIGFGGVAQLQQRPDLPKQFSIVEGSIRIVIKIDQK